MKILMENKKKRIIYIAILAVCLGLIGWIWIPQFGTKQPVVDSSVIAGALNNEVPAGATTPGSASLLPFGENFNTAILNDARFRALIAPKPLTLDPAELGRDNPFLRPEAVLYTPSSTSTATTTLIGE